MPNHVAKAPSRKRKRPPTTQEMRCVSCAKCSRELVGLLDAEFAAMHGMMLSVFVEGRPYCRGCKPPEPTVKCEECGNLCLKAEACMQGPKGRRKWYCLRCSTPKEWVRSDRTDDRALPGFGRGESQIERFATENST